MLLDPIGFCVTSIRILLECCWTTFSYWQPYCRILCHPDQYPIITVFLIKRIKL